MMVSSAPEQVMDDMTKSSGALVALLKVVADPDAAKKALDGLQEKHSAIVAENAKHAAMLKAVAATEAAAKKAAAEADQKKQQADTAHVAVTEAAARSAKELEAARQQLEMDKRAQSQFYANREAELMQREKALVEAQGKLKSDYAAHEAAVNAHKAAHDKAMADIAAVQAKADADAAAAAKLKSDYEKRISVLKAALV